MLILMLLACGPDESERPRAEEAALAWAGEGAVLHGCRSWGAWKCDVRTATGQEVLLYCFTGDPEKSYCQLHVGR